VSESALSTRINAVRTSIGDTGEAQRLVRTLPRKGFRFVGEVREDEVLPPVQAATAPSSSDNSSSATDVAVLTTSSDVATLTTAEPIVQRLDRSSHRRWILPVSIGLVAAVLVAVILVPLTHRTSVSSRGEKFDPGRIPLIESANRTALAEYARKP